MPGIVRRAIVRRVTLMRAVILRAIVVFLIARIVIIGLRGRPIGVARRLTWILVFVSGRWTRQPFGRGPVVGAHGFERLVRPRTADIGEWIALPDQARKLRERIARFLGLRLIRFVGIVRTLLGHTHTITGPLRQRNPNPRLASDCTVQFNKWRGIFGDPSPEPAPRYSVSPAPIPGDGLQRHRARLPHLLRRPNSKQRKPGA